MSTDALLTGGVLVVAIALSAGIIWYAYQTFDYDFTQAPRDEDYPSSQEPPA